MVAPAPGDTTADGCEEHTMNDAAIHYLAGSMPSTAPA